MDTPRLTHVRVNVRDLGRAINWYERIFGLVAEGHWPPEAPSYAHFRTGTTLFALSVAVPVPGGGRFNFTVDDVDAWWRRLAPDAEVVEPLFDTAWGTRKFTVRDPDGNELGFARDDETPQ
jgi:catechol 2,3-dioxygenase-like lactoylglutathione lyase family enzyme